MNATLFRLMILAQEKVTPAMPAPPSATPKMPGAAGLPPISGTPGASPAPGGPGLGEEVGHEAVGFIGKIAGFFKYDFFPNLWMYLTFIFMVVIAVMLFIAINIGVRFILDPIFQKVFRLDEASKGPALIGGVVSIIAAIIIFQFFYATFPALQPPVNFILRHFQ